MDRADGIVQSCDHGRVSPSVGPQCVESGCNPGAHMEGGMGCAEGDEQEKTVVWFSVQKADGLFGKALGQVPGFFNDYAISEPRHSLRCVAGPDVFIGPVLRAAHIPRYRAFLRRK